MSRPPRILDLAATVTLIAALIYTAGWSYAYHWYDRFELGLIGLGIPFEYHFMYGFWVFQWFWWLVLTIAGFVVLTYWARIDPILSLLASTAPVWNLLAFVLTYQMGAAVARSDYQAHREAGFQHYPWVRVWTTPAPAEVPDQLRTVRRDLTAGKYRLLMQTNQFLYLIRPRQDGGGIPTLQVRQDRVHTLRRIPTNPGG